MKGTVVMLVFTCKNFTGHWPVGTAAVIVAPNKGVARRMLNAELIRIGLPQDKELTLEEVDISKSNVEILHDGNY